MNEGKINCTNSTIHFGLKHIHIRDSDEFVGKIVSIIASFVLLIVALFSTYRLEYRDAILFFVCSMIALSGYFIWKWGSPKHKNSELIIGPNWFILPTTIVDVYGSIYTTKTPLKIWFDDIKGIQYWTIWDSLNPEGKTLSLEYQSNNSRVVFLPENIFGVRFILKDNRSIDQNISAYEDEGKAIYTLLCSILDYYGYKVSISSSENSIPNVISCKKINEIQTSRKRYGPVLFLTLAFIIIVRGILLAKTYPINLIIILLIGMLTLFQAIKIREEGFFNYNILISIAILSVLSSVLMAVYNIKYNKPFYSAYVDILLGGIIYAYGYRDKVYRQIYKQCRNNKKSRNSLQ